MFAVGVVLEPLLRLMPELSLEVGRGFWTILSLVIFAPIFEELICRGVVLGSLRGKFGAMSRQAPSVSSSACSTASPCR